MTSLAKPRLYAVVVAWFGVCALLIAGIGLFGVLSAFLYGRNKTLFRKLPCHIKRIDRDVGSSGRGRTRHGDRQRVTHTGRET